MRFSLSWLKSRLKTKLSAEELGKRMTDMGLELEDLYEGEDLRELLDAELAGKSFEFKPSYDDPIFDVNVTANRPDWAGVYGIARDLAAAGFGTLVPLAIPKIKSKGKSPIPVKLAFRKGLEHACPSFYGRYISGVRNGPSPAWMQTRLIQAGARPISALVDITNYMAFDLCRPGHVFDAANLDRSLIIRESKDGESFLGLDGKKYTLPRDLSVLADESKVLGLAGVLGGEDSGCSDGTRDVLLEIAYFDPIRTAASGRTMQVSSDARYRFERGVDPGFLKTGEAIASGLILELCGGQASDVIVVGKEPKGLPPVKYNPRKLKSHGGLEIKDAEQKKILASLGFKIKSGKGAWLVSPPSWRVDVKWDVEVADDILRAKGFDAVPPADLRAVTPLSSKAGLTLRQERVLRSQRVLAARGFLGCVTWSFMLEKDAELFRAINPALRIKNPISSDLGYMRPSILPNLIKAAGRSAAKGHKSGALSEVGPVFWGIEPSQQKTHAVGLRFGAVQDRHWDLKAHQADSFDAKGDILAALKELGIDISKLELRRGADSHFHPGRSGALFLDGQRIGQFGLINPKVMEALDVELAAAGFEIDLDSLPDNRSHTFTRPALVVSELQPLERDFAFVLDEGVSAGDLTRAIFSAEQPEIKSVNIFDVYRGKGIPDGKKSVALSVIIEPRIRALSADEIQLISDRVVSAVVNKVGASLR